METLDKPESTFVAHEPCNACSSKDANSLYTDGSRYCFSCETYTHPDGTSATGSPAHTKVNSSLLVGDYVELRSRRIPEDVCRKYGYMIADYNGQKVHVATYKDSKGRPVAQKIRTADKQFSVVGDAAAMGLFGQHLFSSNKRVIVTEGEIDCMAVASVTRFACVSVPHGAQSAKKHLLKAMDWLSGFDEICIMFDQDEPGQAAAQACAEALPIGKVKIAVLPFKDASECLIQGKADALIGAIFNAQEFRPDGIVSMADLRDTVSQADADSPMKYPYPRLNEMLKGIRQGLITVCAGSGVGKSTLIREFAYGLHQSGFTVGMLMLEESTKRTAQGLVGLHMNKNITIDAQAATAEEITKGFDSLLSSGPVYLFDHFGSADLETICNRIRYMKHGLSCDVVFLDHVSIMISSYAGKETNERVLIDHIMHTLRVLCSELDLAIILVSHLRRPSGERGHEGGEKVSLSQLRGSHSLAQLADGCIGLQVSSEDPASGIRELVVLKNRFTGEVGPADELQYDRQTGRLTAIDNTIPF